MKKTKNCLSLLFSRKVIVSLIFFVVLGLIAPLIIFYSLGYRFDPKIGIFIYSGTVVLKPTPFDVSVFVDGKPLAKKQIDIINQSININGLRPGEYEIKVSKDGYRDWTKKTRVRSGIATEFWNVTLAPNDSKAKEVLEKNIVKNAFSPNKKKLAYFTREEESLAFYFRDNAGDHLISKETTNERLSVEAGEIKWSGNNNWLIFSFKKGGQEQVWLFQTDSPDSTLISLNDILPQPPENNDSPVETISDNNLLAEPKQKEKKVTVKPDFYTWDDGGDLYVLSDKKILNFRLKDIVAFANKKLADNKNRNINSNENTNNNENGNKNSAPSRNNNTNLNDNGKESSSVSSSTITDKSDGFTFCGSYLCSLSTGERKIKILSLTGNLIKEVDFSTEMNSEFKYQIFAYGEKLLAIIDEKKGLFLWDETRFKETGIGPITKIGENVTDVYFSDDGKKLLFKTENEAIVYFVRDWEVQPKHLIGEKEIVYSQSDKIEKVQWFYDYQNILVANKKEIWLLELDGREGRNKSLLFGSDKEIFDLSYDGGERKLWFSEGENKDSKKLKEIIFPESSSIFSNIIGE